MAIELPDDYWIDVPGGTYTVGFTPEDARLYGELAAAYKNAQPLPAWDEWKEVEERQTKSGNPEYLAAWALRTRPARTVEIPPYRIARYPVTGAQFLRFVEETGATASDEALARSRSHPDWPVRGASWQHVEAFMAWSGCRVPFDEEWERAARGPERRIFPWGNDFGARGAELLELARADKLSPEQARRFATPDGFMAYADKGWEWCANLYYDPDAWQVDDPWLRERGRWQRRIKGLSEAYDPPSIAGLSGAMEGAEKGFRLVKHNGREIPVAPPMTGWSAAGPRAREFEDAIVRPALAAATPDLEFHRAHIWSNARSPDPFNSVPSYLDDSFRESFGHSPGTIPDAYPFPPDRPAVGVYLGAATMESIRRVVSPHQGLFLWTILYRLDKDQNLLAHPVVFYRMHYDGQWHRFDDRFRPGEDLTPIAEITPAMISAHVLEAFRIYEETADADGPPPPADRRETRTPADPVFKVR